LEAIWPGGIRKKGSAAKVRNALGEREAEDRKKGRGAYGDLRNLVRGEQSFLGKVRVLDFFPSMNAVH